MKNAPHLSDQELLLYLDGELPRGQATRIQEHMTGCWKCRVRAADLEAAIGEFMRMRDQALATPLPSIAGPRAQLKARLADLSRSTQEGRWLWHRLAPQDCILVAACVLALIAVLGSFVSYRPTVESRSDAFRYGASLPNPRLTPGATKPVRLKDICSMNHDDVIRTVSSVLQQSVLREYGVGEVPAGSYEIDFLISPGLGGAEDIHNLWPQPRNTVWNSFVKDQLEDYLHQSVCGGKISLAAAQQDIATNWIVAYKAYFHTDEPLLDASRARMLTFPRPAASIYGAVQGNLSVILLPSSYRYR